jgi:hypothetical protein
MSERQQLKIFVRPAAKEAVERVCERYGMTQQEMCSRVYEWFSEQDEGLQATVLGLLPDEYKLEMIQKMLQDMSRTMKESTEETMRIAAKRMTGPKHGKPFKRNDDKKP